MIEILLATYNGEKYLKDQINSILNQSYKNWRLLIFDDASVDETCNIIKFYEEKYSDKIKCFRAVKNSKSVKKSFSKLLAFSRAEYLCLADQDDVWGKDKLKCCFEYIKKIEEQNKDVPILVHTDLFVVDENLNVIASSMMKLQKLKSKEKTFRQLLVQNNITGCTVLMNRKLAELCGEIPEGALMHDWWLGLVACAFGIVKFLNKSTVYYRQHQNNFVGAKNVFSLKYFLNRVFNAKDVKKRIKLTYAQSEEFLKMYEEMLTYDNINILKKYLEIKDCKKLRKILKLVGGGFLKDGIFRKIGQIFYI